MLSRLLDEMVVNEALKENTYYIRIIKHDKNIRLFLLLLL